VTPMINSSAIINETRSWIGPPYRHQASVKGVGCDCLGLVRGVWRALYGREPAAMPGYTPDWAEASGTETLAEAAARHMTKLEVGDAAGGDLVLFHWRANVPAKHCGIVVADGAVTRFVHAQQGAVVTEATLTPWWRRRVAFAFRFPEAAAVGSRQ
jgi:NlpC/P60 family putative phage cell wall peptidase